MKITRVEPFHVAIPYEHGAPKPTMSTGLTRATMDAVYVRVDTDEGLTGWGEAFGFAACPVTVTALRRVVGPLAVGRECGDVPALMEDLRRKTQSQGLNGPVGFALSGIDIALWDIASKAQGLPVHRLLGGSRSTVGSGKTIPTYASLLRVGPEHLPRVCERATTRGYRHIKLHEKTVESVAVARSHLGPAFPLMLDVNCAFAPDEAVAVARKLKPYGLAWFEEPVFPADDYGALARLRAEGTPIAAGENLGNVNEVRRIVEAEAVDVVQPDVCKMGGITETWKALTLAHDMGVAAEPHSPYYGPGLIASLHLLAAMEHDALCEYFFADLEASPLGEAAIPRDGFLAVPDGPGLGIEVDEKLVERYAAK